MVNPKENKNINKKLPLVSISVMCYNQKHFLDECFSGLLNQTYKNIQIVVGDDASTDGSQKILKHYKKKYPEVFKLVLHKKNKGITENSQSILEKCDGKYIAITAADDIFLPEKIKKQVEVMESNPDVAMCYHNVEVFDSQTNKALFFFNDYNRGLYPYQGKITEKLLERRCFIGATSLFLKKSVIPDGYDNRIKYESDYQIMIDASTKGKAVYINEVLARYRRHDNNNTTKTKFYYKDGLITYDIMEKKYPKYKKSINKGRAYYFLIILYKSFIGFHVKDFLIHAIKFFGLCIFRPYAFLYILRVIWKSIIRRV
jgi:glycosyltransferase involved in cell wall biosynthesis